MILGQSSTFKCKLGLVLSTETLNSIGQKAAQKTVLCTPGTYSEKNEEPAFCLYDFLNFFHNFCTIVEKAWVS